MTILSLFQWASKKAVHTLKKAYKLKEVEEHLKRIELSDTSLTQAQQSNTMLDTETKDAINVILDKVVNSEPKTLKLWKGDSEPIKKCKSLKTIVNEAGSTLTKCIQNRSELMCYIQIRTSRMCIQSGRNICLSLLEYPKSMYLIFLLFHVIVQNRMAVIHVNYTVKNRKWRYYI